MRSLIFLFIIYLPTSLWADCQVTLQWDPVSGSGIYYQLYLREAGTNYDFNTFEWQGSQTQWTVDQLDETKTYYFVVRATNAQGNQSGDSNEVAFKYGSTSNNTAGLSNSSGGGGGSSGGCFIQTLLSP